MIGILRCFQITQTEKRDLSSVAQFLFFLIYNIGFKCTTYCSDSFLQVWIILIIVKLKMWGLCYAILFLCVFKIFHFTQFQI